MANFKHKVFLLIAKWIPVAVAAGILINNTLAMLDVKDVILDLFDSEIGSLNDEQRNILFSDAKYIQIDNQLKQLIQEALINSVKNVIEQSPNGKELLTQQLNYIKSSKNAIVAESNRKLELFEKFQIAAKANPNLTYKEFCESINK